MCRQAFDGDLKHDIKISTDNAENVGSGQASETASKSSIPTPHAHTESLVCLLYS